MPRYERILPLIGIVLMGMGLILLVGEINTLILPIFLTGDTEVRVSVAWLILFLLLVVVAIGTESVQRDDAEEPAGRRRLHPVSWILPMLLPLAAFLFLGGPVFDLLARAVGLGLLGALLLAVFIAQHYGHDAQPAVRNWSYLIQDLLVYVTAFFLYSAIYGQRVRSLISATSIVVLTFLFAVALLHRLDKRASLLYAAVIGLGVGEITWPLNYWVISGMFGGVLLLAAFYALVNPARYQLQGQLTWRMVAEYVAVGLLIIAGVGFYGFLWPR